MTPADTVPHLPYIGLRPFDEADHPLFFGREEQVNGTLTQLENHAFLAVVGSSGSGKSSFVRAGLLPAVREGFLLGTADWMVAIVKPGQQPYSELALALYRVAVNGAAPSLAALQRVLRGSDRGLEEALQLCGYSGVGGVMVVIDQFEELFAFRRNVAMVDVASRDEAAAFVRLLLHSCADPSGAIRVVVTMRSDFIGDCEVFLGLPEAISRNQFLVPRLDRTQMEWAIAGPAALSDMAYRPFGFEDGLINCIVNDAGDRPDQLPLLQHALMRTWNAGVKRGAQESIQLTFEDYRSAGGVLGSLSLHADAAWAELDGERQQEIARRMFLLLADVGLDGQLIRRMPSVGEVRAVTGATIAELRAVMQVFQHDERNFLCPAAGVVNDEAASLDISHESLIRQWRMFNCWVAKESDMAAMFRRLRERATRWPEQESHLRDPALSLARTWLEQHQPTEAWAERYGGGLARTKLMWAMGGALSVTFFLIYKTWSAELLANQLRWSSEELRAVRETNEGLDQKIRALQAQHEKMALDEKLDAMRASQLEKNGKRESR